MRVSHAGCVRLDRSAREEELEEPLGDGDGRGEAPGGDEAGEESGLVDSGGTTIWAEQGVAAG